MSELTENGDDAYVNSQHEIKCRYMFIACFL